MESYQKAGGGKRGDAWCSWFVSAGFRRTGILTAYFGRARSWFDAAHVILSHGRPVAGAPVPAVGDLVGYEWGAATVSHVGYLNLWGSTPMCQTVEGNTSGASKTARVTRF